MPPSCSGREGARERLYGRGPAGTTGPGSFLERPLERAAGVMGGAAVASAALALALAMGSLSSCGLGMASGDPRWNSLVRSVMVRSAGCSAVFTGS